MARMAAITAGGGILKLKKNSCEEVRLKLEALSGVGGGTRLYGLYRYVRPQRVSWFLSRFTSN